MFTCKICGIKQAKITPAHMKFRHNMTLAEYYEKYGQPEVEVIPSSHPIDDLLTEEEATVLEPDQKEYIVHRVVGKGKIESIEAVGKNPTALYTTRFKESRDVIENAVSRIKAGPYLVAARTLLDAAPDAADKLKDLIADEDPRIALHASDSVLDRVGLSKRPQISLDLDFTHVSTADLDRSIEADLKRLQAEESAIEGDFQILEDLSFGSPSWERAMMEQYEEKNMLRTLNSFDELQVRVYAIQGKRPDGTAVDEAERKEILNRFGLNWKL